MCDPITGIIISSVISGGFQYMGQKKQMKAAKRRAAEAAAARQRGEALQRRRDDIMASRQRRRSAAEARRLRATAVNVGAQRGFGGAIGQQGSTLAGFQGSIQSQLNYNNAFINRVTEVNQGIRSAFGQAQDIASRPISAGMGLMAFGNLVGSVGKSYFGMKARFNPGTGYNEANLGEMGQGSLYGNYE
tara:strand:- start:437 stop:1003 length:567 start_codon:yes stop_codon:yes gene_type:complete